MIQGSSSQVWYSNALANAAVASATKQRDGSVSLRSSASSQAAPQRWTSRGLWLAACDSDQLHQTGAFRLQRLRKDAAMGGFGSLRGEILQPLEARRN